MGKAVRGRVPSEECLSVSVPSLLLLAFGLSERTQTDQDSRAYYLQTSTTSAGCCRWRIVDPTRTGANSSSPSGSVATT